MGKQEGLSSGSMLKKVTCKTPHHVCSFVLHPPNNSKINASYQDTNTYDYSPSNNELAFMRQISLKGQQFGSNSNLSHVSNLTQSRHSIGTILTNHSSSTFENAGSLKRASSFSSTGTTSSGMTNSQQVLNPKTATTSFALPTNQSMATPLQIAFRHFLLVPTRDGNIFLYQIADFSYAEEHFLNAQINSTAAIHHDQSYNNVTSMKKLSAKMNEEKQCLLPILSLGPFEIGEAGRSFGNNSQSKSALNAATIVGISVFDNIKSKNQNQNNFMGNVAVLTQCGCVHIYDFYRSGNDGESSDQLKVAHHLSFSTGKLSATAIAMHRGVTYEEVTINGQSLRQRRPVICIAVGYDDGTISEYTIVDKLNSLKWRGYIDYKINCLEYIQTETKSRPSNLNEPTAESLYLVIGTAVDDFKKPIKECTTEAVISSCLDVIKITDARKDFSSKFKKLSQRRSPSSMIYLAHLSIWPNTSVLEEYSVAIVLPEQKNKKSQSPYRSFSVYAIDTFHGQKNQIVVLLGNGCLCSFSYYVDPVKGFCWKSNPTNSNLMLPFASSAGVKTFMQSSTSSKSIPFFACCLRSGSLVFGPLTANAETKNDIHLHNIPSDTAGFDDDTIKYAQGFTAGNIFVKTWGVSNSYSEQPCFFVAWPNGSIDCYRIGSSQEEWNSKEGCRKQILHELYSNGTIQRLIELFSVDGSETQVETSLFTQASREYKKINLSEEDLFQQILEETESVSSINMFLDQIMNEKERKYLFVNSGGGSL